MPDLVGERGPEIMVPGSSGQVIPNRQIGGGGVSIVQHIDMRGVDPSMRAFITAQTRTMKDQAVREATAAVAKTNRDRPGYLSK